MKSINSKRRLAPGILRVALCARIALLTGIATLSGSMLGCGNLSHVYQDGKAEKPVFPRIDQVQGTWPNLENLRQIQKGMTKAQIQALLGPPHFGEGLFNVREWDYLLHISTQNGVLLCQYKILFDTDLKSRSFIWNPQSCSEAVRAQPGA